MVETFGIATDERELGYFAGYLASSYFFCQFISSFFLGYLSDRIGRKPVLMAGTCGTLLSCMLFGFSSNYAMAIAARSIGGLLNCTYSFSLIRFYWKFCCIMVAGKLRR
jgi:MFS family permease